MAGKEENANGDAASTNSSNTISEQEKTLSSQSYGAFEQGDYAKSRELLQKLSSTRSSDPKVMLNKGLVEFCASGLKNTNKFKYTLTDVAKVLHVDVNKLDTLDDVDHCVLYFNQALMFYHLHQYKEAIEVLDKIFLFIEPLDSVAAKQVCFLLIELYLCTSQPEKALGFVNYVDKMLFQSNSNSNAKAGSPEKDVKEKSTKSCKSEPNDKPHLQQLKVRCYLMLKSMKVCKRELKNLMTSGSSHQAAYLKGNMEYLRSNFKKAIRVLNTAATVDQDDFSVCGENIAVQYYNNMGCIHMYCGKQSLGNYYFNKALQLNNNLVKNLLSTNEQGKISSKIPLPAINGNKQSALLYNMGIALLHAGKSQQAFDCLLQAVQVYKTNARLWLRMAECCIKIYKPTNEIDYKVKNRKMNLVDRVVGSGPHRKLILAPHASPKPSKESPSATPTLQFASMCLKNALYLINQYAPSSGCSVSQAKSAKSPKVHEDQEKSSSPQQVPSSSSANEFSIQYIPALPVNPIYGNEVALLRASILIASSYVSLCLGDPVMSLHYAETVLAVPKIQPKHKFLAHMYAGEALILLDRISESIEYLNSDMFGSDFVLNSDANEGPKESCGESANNASTVGGKDSVKHHNITKDWFPSSTASARTTMLYNLTVAYTLRGELEKAGVNLKQVGMAQGPDSEIPVQAVLLAMYIQLQLGHADLTKNIMKQYCPQFR